MHKINTIGVLLLPVVLSANAGLPQNTSIAGDSITMGFAADCKYNRYFWDLFCLLGGDQPEHSWFDGDQGSVKSIHDRYLSLDSAIRANKSAAKSGSELRGGDNNFVVQATNIVEQSNVTDHVEVLLGGNDICNRDCIDPSHCSNPIYSEEEWRTSVRQGLNILVSGLSLGSTVYLGGVPRVQDLRTAGLEKQASSSRIRCESVWETFNICPIATSGSTLNGESSQFRLSAISQWQRRYNEILAQEAAAYTANTEGQNTRGIQVISDYVDETTPSTGTTSFGANEIDGGDCFHPSVAGQNVISERMWLNNPDK